MNAYFLGFKFKNSSDVKMRSDEIHKINTMSQLKKVEEGVLCINGASDSILDRTRFKSIFEKVNNEKTHVIVVRDDKNYFREFEREIAFIDGTPNLKSNEIVANFINKVRLSIQMFVGNCKCTIDLKSKIFNACFSDRNFFITGENGSGRHLLAKVVHNASLRLSGPFVFFHKNDEIMAKIHEADGGHLFIEDLSSVTEKNKEAICNFLKDRSYTKSDVRIISSTSEDIDKTKNIFPCIDSIFLDIQPLRNRKSDISMIIDDFIKNSGYNFHFEDIPLEMRERFYSYDYPGNVRELRDIIYRYLFSGNPLSNFQDIFISSFMTNTISCMIAESGNTSLPELKKKIYSSFEKAYVDKLLENYSWTEDKFSQIFEDTIKNLNSLVKKCENSKEICDSTFFE